MGKHDSGQDPQDPDSMRDEGGKGDGWSAGNTDDSQRGRGNTAGEAGHGDTPNR